MTYSVEVAALVVECLILAGCAYAGGKFVYRLVCKRKVRTMEEVRTCSSESSCDEFGNENERHAIILTDDEFTSEPDETVAH